MKRLSCSPVLRALVLAALFITSCKTVSSIGQPPAQPVETATEAVLAPPSPPEDDDAPAPTVTAPSATAEVIPTRGPTVTAIRPPALTPAPEFAITVEPGLELFTHPEIPAFVFPADPRLWEQVSGGENPFAFLRHTRLPGCAISAVPGRGIGTPKRLLRWQLGRLYWIVLDDGSYALANIDQPANLFLDLQGLDNRDCRSDQQAVMERVLLKAELEGSAAYNPLPTATQRPPLEGFDCPNTPPVRLRAGDTARIVTNDLWLRSAPQPTDDSEVALYDSTDPVMIDVLEGPVCGGKFAYWKVRVSLIGEGAPEPVTGWFAEGDLREYYLEPGF